MQIQKLCTEVAELLEHASMMGHQDQKLLRATLVDALAADTGISRSDVDALLLIHEANVKIDAGPKRRVAEGTATGAITVPLSRRKSEVVGCEKQSPPPDVTVEP